MHKRKFEDITGYEFSKENSVNKKIKLIHLSNHECKLLIQKGDNIINKKVNNDINNNNNNN